MLPSCNSTSLFTIVNPNPVPPYFLEVSLLDLVAPPGEGHAMTIY